jgi:phosphate transport system substrate-binding protein
MKLHDLIFSLLILLTACSPDNKTIKIKGSDTEVNLAVQLAESFHEINSEVFVSITGGGSGLGIASLLNETADIANSSRSINDDEIELFHKKRIQIDSFEFAQDAIAFVVADDLPIDSVSTSELADIISGKYKYWNLKMPKKKRINIYGRQSNSGTHDFIKTKLGINFSPYAKQMNGNAQILEAIKVDHSGIGYVGAGYVLHSGKGIKVLPVYQDKKEAAVSPLDSSMINAGKYFFQRPLFQYYKSDSYEKIKLFLDFEKSDAGQKIIQQSGYYPVK